jgi:hypothetical protein
MGLSCDVGYSRYVGTETSELSMAEISDIFKRKCNLWTIGMHQCEICHVLHDSCMNMRDIIQLI